jgi:hypothetical protein
MTPLIPDLVNTLAITERILELNGVSRHGTPPSWPASAARVGGSPGEHGATTATTTAFSLPTITFLKLEAPEMHGRIHVPPRGWCHTTIHSRDGPITHGDDTLEGPNDRKYWSNMATRLLRMLHHHTPPGGWHMAHVNDSILNLNKTEAHFVRTLIDTINDTIGAPLAQRFTSLGERDILIEPQPHSEIDKTLMEKHHPTAPARESRAGLPLQLDRWVDILNRMAILHDRLGQPRSYRHARPAAPTRDSEDMLIMQHQQRLGTRDIPRDSTTQTSTDDDIEIHEPLWQGKGLDETQHMIRLDPRRCSATTDTIHHLTISGNDYRDISEELTHDGTGGSVEPAPARPVWPASAARSGRKK